MRLVCPNCEAKYEVPDDAIPDTGRDVQCANCGHGWFQTRSKAVTAPPVVVPAAAPVVAPVAEGPVAAVGGEGAAPEMPARAQDEEVLAVLREEADREIKARREKGKSPASKLDAAAERAVGPKTTPEPAAKAAKPAAVAPAPVEAAPAEAKPDVAEAAPAAAVAEEAEVELKVAARRDLLPDVEEIKSTLQPSEEPVPEFAAGLDAAGRSGAGGFRAGFLTVITIAILGASVYSSANFIATKVPSLAGPLASYVASVDAFRVRLDSLIAKATDLIAGGKG